MAGCREILRTGLPMNNSGMTPIWYWDCWQTITTECRSLRVYSIPEPTRSSMMPCGRDTLTRTGTMTSIMPMITEDTGTMAISETSTCHWRIWRNSVWSWMRRRRSNSMRSSVSSGLMCTLSWWREWVVCPSSLRSWFIMAAATRRLCRTPERKNRKSMISFIMRFRI